MANWTSCPTQEQIHKTGDTAALERVQQVKLNAEEQLLRAKGQVARLQSGPTPNQSLSREVRSSGEPEQISLSTGHRVVYNVTCISAGKQRWHRCR